MTSVPGRRLLKLGVVIGILAVGAYFRFLGLNWDLGTGLHPDESFLASVIASLEFPSSVAGYFDTATSPLNPHNAGFDFFVYGTFPVFLIRLVGGILGGLGNGGVYLVGRALSGAFDLATLLLTYLVARRLYDDRVAFLALALSAATVLHIQQSHFMTVDTFATTLVLLTLLCAALVAQEGKLWQYLGMGFAIGLAVASRINMVLLGLLTVVAAGLDLRRVVSDHSDSKVQVSATRTVIARLVVVGVVSLIVFRVFQPYAFAGPGFLNIDLSETWLQDMREIQGLRSGEIDYPPSHQWTNRPAYLFPWSHMVLWGMGLPLGLAGWAGWALAGWQLVRHRNWQHALPVAWVLIEFGYQGQQFTKNMRYFLPIYPILAMLAAFLIVWLWDQSKGKKGIREKGKKGIRGRGKMDFFPFQLFSFSPRSLFHSRVFAGTLAFVVLGGTYLWAFAFTRIYTRPVTRVAASRWVYDHVPSAATVHYTTENGGVGQTQVPLYLEQSSPMSDRFVVELHGTPFRTSFTPVADGRLQSVKLTSIRDQEMDAASEVVEVTLAGDPAGRRVLASKQITVHLEQTTDPQTVRFDGVPVEAERRYYLLSRPLAGGTITFGRQEPGIVTYQTSQRLEIEALRPSYVVESDRGRIVYRQDGSQKVATFELPEPGGAQSVTMNYLADPVGDPDPETFYVAILGDLSGQRMLAQGQITAQLEEADQLRGKAYTFELPAVELEAGREYFLFTQLLRGAPAEARSSVIANEYWDRPLPLSLGNKDGFQMYLDFFMDLYANDSPEKLDRIAEWLDQADYVMITSNRLYGSIPRLPMRYPITTEYYRLLFQERLGFEIEETFTSYPNIGPFQIPDQSAEESFTVYDHPKVWIFHKTDEFSPVEVRRLLADAAEGPFVPLKPIEVSDPPREIPLPRDGWIRRE